GGRRVAFADPFVADALGEPFDLLDVDAEVGQTLQRRAGLGEGATGDAGVDDLLLQGRASFSLVDAQAFGLREKKPAGSGNSGLRVRSIQLRRPAFARDAGR